MCYCSQRCIILLLEVLKDECVIYIYIYRRSLLRSMVNVLICRCTYLESMLGRRTYLVNNYYFSLLTNLDRERLLAVQLFVKRKFHKLYYTG